MPDLTACPVTREHARTLLRGAEPVGFRALTEATSTEPCTDGCMAPGSSPHFHSRITGWEIVGPRGIVTVTPDGSLCIRDSSLHPFPA